MKKITSVVLLVLLVFCFAATATAMNVESMTREERGILIKQLVEANARDAAKSSGTMRNLFDCTRFDPLYLGETVTVTLTQSKIAYQVSIRLDDVIRGKKANTMVKDANRYNDEPKKGWEYIIGVISITIISGESDSASASFSRRSFDVVSRSGTKYRSASIVGLDDSLELFTGGTGTLYVAGLVETKDEPLLLYGDTLWIDMKK